MTEKEIQHFRERRQLKTNYSKDWLLFALTIPWILSIKFVIEYAFNFLNESKLFLFLLIILSLLSVTFVFVMSIRLRAGVSQIKKNEHFNFKQLLNSLKNENWVIVREEDDLILAETDPTSTINSIVILIYEDLIFFNNRPNSIRPFAYLSDWKIRKRLKEIIGEA